jgi:arabinogalactan oligomer/maltooligosaccharide transport system permease protein
MSAEITRLAEPDRAKVIAATMPDLPRDRSAFEEILVHVALIAATAVALYPILWVLGLAFGSDAAPTARVFPLPRSFDGFGLQNFRAVVGTYDAAGRWLFGRQLANSLLVSLATAAVGVAIATPAAYALARFRFYGRDRGVLLLMATQMFPGVATLVPLYLLLERLHLLDSRAGLVLVYATTAVPFCVMQLRSAFEAIPVDLEEAAMVDGATRAQAFRLVALPAARPAIAVTALFAFMSAWNEFILAATLLGREEAFTLPVALQRHVGEHGASWGAFAAGAIVVSIPVMALFYLAQRQIVAGLTAGSVKG